MYYLKGISALSVLIAMLLPVNPAWGQDDFDAAQAYIDRGCRNCHASGSGPSITPTPANKANWENRLGTTRNNLTGMARLYDSAMNGISFMQSCSSYGVASNKNCKAIVDYMLTAVGISVAKLLYNDNCSNCHNNGTLVNNVNAPIANMESANQADWNTRLTASGGYIEGIYDSILASPSSSTLSYKNMCASVEDEQCKQITDYMIETLAGVSIVRESVVRDLYTTNCSSCHNTGENNAPIANMESANQANWKNRLKERDGIEGIYTSIGSTLAWMCAAVTSKECEQIADYMIETLAGVSTEPEPPGTQIKLKLLLEGAINSSSE